RKLSPKPPGGPDLPAGKDKDPRVALAAWLVEPQNPFFARAMVNRLWAHYFGRGLVDPPDGLAAANPASHPALLNELARRFAASNDDLKAAHRLLLNSHAYQRTGKTNETNKPARPNFAHPLPRRLAAAQAIA